MAKEETPNLGPILSRLEKNLPQNMGRTEAAPQSQPAEEWKNPLQGVNDTLSKRWVMDEKGNYAQHDFNDLHIDVTPQKDGLEQIAQEKAEKDAAHQQVLDRINNAVNVTKNVSKRAAAGAMLVGASSIVAEPIIHAVTSPQIVHAEKSKAPTYSFANDKFRDTWMARDGIPDDQKDFHAYYYGPAFSEGLSEEFKIDGKPSDLLVQYYDKARMELHPDGTVTTGLLAPELILNNVDIAVGGDNGTVGVTYADFRTVSTVAQNENKATNLTGKAVVDGLYHGTGIKHNDYDGKYGEIANEHYFEQTGHNVPDVILDAFGPTEEGVDLKKAIEQIVSTAGFPLSEAYWTKFTVNGKQVDVLVQAFQRRIITYTPTNPPGQQVEWGNTGQHAYNWRYGHQGVPTPTPLVTEIATQVPKTPIPTATWTPRPEATATATRAPEAGQPIVPLASYEHIPGYERLKGASFGYVDADGKISHLTREGQDAPIYMNQALRAFAEGIFDSPENVNEVIQYMNEHNGDLDGLYLPSTDGGRNPRESSSHATMVGPFTINLWENAIETYTANEPPPNFRKVYTGDERMWVAWAVVNKKLIMVQSPYQVTYNGGPRENGDASFQAEMMLESIGKVKNVGNYHESSPEDNFYHDIGDSINKGKPGLTTNPSIFWTYNYNTHAYASSLITFR